MEKRIFQVNSLLVYYFVSLFSTQWIFMDFDDSHAEELCVYVREL